MTTLPPGYVASIWTVDPERTKIEFSLKHLKVETVRGSFTRFAGRITTADEPLGSSVHVDIDVASLDSGDSKRDEATLDADVFAAGRHPRMTFDSGRIGFNGQRYVVDGELAVRGVRRLVKLELDVIDFDGKQARFTARTAIKRHDFGVRFKFPFDLMVSDAIEVSLDVGVLRAD